jgi:hypothetical protein
MQPNWVAEISQAHANEKILVYLSATRWPLMTNFAFKVPTLVVILVQFLSGNWPELSTKHYMNS